MKRLIAALVTGLMLVGLTIPGTASYESKTDYMELMIQAVMKGDTEAGAEAEAARNEKIKALGLDYDEVTFDDLLLLSRVIYREAGSNWLSEEWKMSVGEVVLNRVASEEFPNTVREVVMQPGQYGGLTKEFKYLRPSRICVEIALRLLSGERILDEPSVVFQSNGHLGSGVYKKLVDDQLGVTTRNCTEKRPSAFADGRLLFTKYPRRSIPGLAPAKRDYEPGLSCNRTLP